MCAFFSDLIATGGLPYSTCLAKYTLPNDPAPITVSNIKSVIARGSIKFCLEDLLKLFILLTL
jgi:hypothetical protein